MKVFKRSGSSYYAYKFQHCGKEYYRSTGTENRREAEAIAGAARARIVRQAAGLEEPEPQRKSSASDEKPKGADVKICGELLIKRGLKRRARKRKLVIDHEMKEVLERLLKDSKCDYVFTSPQDPTKPVGPWVLEEQIGQVQKKIKTHPDAGLHAMRHTFLTEAGEYTDPFTLQYVAGHDNIKTTMRYVHPRKAAVHKLFARLADLQRPEDRIACEKSVQNPVQLEMPSQDELAKLLITSNLQSAEVVELADTPS